MEGFADDIVCLAPLNREQPADQRLRALLHAAFESGTGGAPVNRDAHGQDARATFDECDLIRQATAKGTPKTSLEDWLRDDFFAQHCALFHSRPFLLAGDVGTKGAGLFRAKPGIVPQGKPDRGTEPQRDKTDYP